MKNRNLHFLLLALLMPLAMWGQETLKLYENEGYNFVTYLPIEGGAVHKSDLKSEYIIPASDLSAMNGKNIYAMDFFLMSPTYSTWGNARFQVFMREVEETEFPSSSPSFYGTEGATIVYEGALDSRNDVMTVAFDNPYHYSGGNLLVGFYITQPGTRISAYFYVKSTYTYGATTYPAYQGSDGVYNRRYYIPRTTFVYASAPVEYPRPRNLKGQGVTANSATFTWTNGSEETAWQIVYSNDPAFNPDEATPISVTQKPYTIDNLVMGSNYYIYLRADYGNGNYSAWSDVLVVEPDCFIPTGLQATEVTSSSAKLSWTAGNYETSFQLAYSSNPAFDPEYADKIDVSQNTYTLENLTAETMYYAYVRANCGNNQYSDWSNVCSFMPTNAIDKLVVDGSNTNSYVPIYFGMTAYTNVRSQFIIPAANFADITDNGPIQIKKLTFYIYSPYSSVSWAGAVFKVYLKESENAVFSGTTSIPWTEMTEVYNGNLSISNNEMVVFLSDAFEYHGGNLVVGINQTATACEEIYERWLGQNTSTSCALYGYNSGNISAQFLPKTKISYFEAPASTCTGPTNLGVSGITTSAATLTWIAGDEETNWNVQYKASSASYWSEVIAVENTPTCAIDELIAATDYDVRVQANCGGSVSPWLTGTFTTKCEPEGLPFSYNFDSDAAGATAAFPQCWIRYNDAINASYQCYPQVYNSSYYHSSPNTLWFRALSNDDNYPNTQMAILPEMNANVNTLMLNFWASSSTGGTLKIGVMTDPDDITTYTEVGAVSIADYGAKYPTKYAFNLSPYEGNGRYIAIRMDKTTTSSVIFVDDINLTTIVPEAIPYTHNFDTDDTGVYAGAPEGWIFIGKNYPRVYSQYPHSGQNTLHMYHDNNNANMKQMVVLPEVSLNTYTMQELQLSFWMRTNSNASLKNLNVGVMTDPNDPSTFTTVKQISGKVTYDEYIITFDNYSGQGKYIAISDFAYNSSVSFYIDDIAVEPIPSCKKPGRPYVDSYSIQAHQVWMSWDKGSDTQTLWQLALGNSEDFNPDEVTPVDVDVTNDELFSDYGTGCSYYLTGLDAATTYYVYVRGNCGTATEPDWSDWCTLPREFTTLGCDIPTGLAVASYTSTTVSLWWNSDNGLASEYELAYSTDEFFNPESPDDDTHVITGITELGYAIGEQPGEVLTPETVYYACVRANCGTDGYSDWSETISFMPSAMHTMTLYDDWKISSRAPLSMIHVHYDPDKDQQGIKGQYVLPEIHLSELRFSNIHGISLFTANTSLNFNTNALFDVFVAVVDEPVMNGLASFDPMTQVYSGSLSVIDGVMTIPFTNPFYYSEGNLMIGFKQITVGGEHNTEVSWKGINPHVVACYTYDYFFGTLERDFSPTTQFRYEPCNAPSCPRPRMLKALPMSTFAKLSWSSGNGNCDVQYKKTTDAEWTLVEGVGITTYQPYILRDLTPSTSYVYQVRNVCSDTEHSDWSKSCYFNTRSDQAITIDVNHVYTEGFDGNVFPPANWVTESDNYVSYWKQRETTQEHYLVAYSGYYNDARMYSPELHIDAQGAVLTLNHMHNSSLNGTATYCDIRVSTDHGEHFSNLWGGKDATVVGDWVTTQISLDYYVNQDIVLEFNHLTYNANHAWDINEIKIKAYDKVFNGDNGSGSWNDPNMWALDNGELPTAEDEVLVNSEVTITDGTVAAAGQIYLNSAENNEVIQGGIVIEDGGQLQVNDTVTVNMQTNVNGYGRGSSNWYLIAPPVQQSLAPSSNHVSGVLEGSYDLYGFDGSQEGEEWRNYKQHQNEFVFVNGHGYLVANSADVHPSFKGTVLPSNQNKTVDIAYDATTFGAWNLVGNPFTCDAYFQDGRSFYRMNGEGSALVSASGVIHPMEGVFVEATGANQSVIFTTTAPQPGGGKGIVNLVLSKNQGGRSAVETESDRVFIRFDEGENLSKFALMSSSDQLYISENGKEYAVVHAQPVGVLPLNFEADGTGVYTIGVSVDDLKVSYLHLVDNLTGNDVDLMQTPYYTFDARPSDYASRFKVVFAIGDTMGNGNFAFVSDGHIVITGANGNAVVQVIDLLGRVLFTGKDVMHGISTEGMTPGVYVIRLIQGDQVKSQKIVIE